MLYRIRARGDPERDDEESARAHVAANGDRPANAESRGRRWTLPAGVVTLETGEDAARARENAAWPGTEPPGA